LKQRWAYFGLLSTAAALLSFQLFVPPIVGLANNGDFQRVIGVFGYGPDIKPDPTFAYVANSYVPDSGVRRPGYEQFTSEYFFVGIALALSKILPGTGHLPITFVGFVHGAALLAALARLFWVTAPFSQRAIIWAGSVFVITDVGYAAYNNSLFSEAASCVFLVWWIAETVQACAHQQVVVYWFVATALLLSSKGQNAPLAIPVAVFCAAMAWKLRRHWKSFAAAGAVSLAVGSAIFLTVPKRAQLENSYNMLFSSVLPESRDPRGDLRALGLSEDWVRLKGSLSWSPDSGLYEERVRQVLPEKAGPLKIVEFYARRPTRLWRHITTLIPIATGLRPECCGNFEPQVGRPPKAISYTLALWSEVHARWLPKVLKALLAALVVTAATGLFRNGWFWMAGLLASMCLTAFMTAAFGDAAEPVKHQFLFNLLLDACLVFWLAGAINRIGRVRRLQTNSNTPPTANPTIRNGSNSSQTIG